MKPPLLIKKNIGQKIKKEIMAIEGHWEYEKGHTREIIAYYNDWSIGLEVYAECNNGTWSFEIISVNQYYQGSYDVEIFTQKELNELL